MASIFQIGISRNITCALTDDFRKSSHKCCVNQAGFCMDSHIYVHALIGHASCNVNHLLIPRVLIPYSGLFSRGKIFANARCCVISRGKFLRMANKELINNHTSI